MKNTTLVAELTKILNSTDKEAEIQALIKTISSSTEVKGKLTYFIEIGEMVKSPEFSYPKQMEECYKILAEGLDSGKPVTRETVIELINLGAERLKTKQAPERIFSFYQKRMEDEGWLIRSKERI